MSHLIGLGKTTSIISACDMHAHKKTNKTSVFTLKRHYQKHETHLFLFVATQFKVLAPLYW